MNVFINYRRGDADATALLLYDRLAARIGSENLFLDVKTLQAGTHWLEEIKTHGAHGGVFLALIGTTWLDRLKERQHAEADGVEDVVTLELELALHSWPGRVIPLLVGGASMPQRASLPRPIRSLADCHALELRHTSFDQDVERLVAKLETIETDGAPGPSESEPARALHDEARQPAVRPRRRPTPPRAAAALPAPDDSHYDTVLQCMLHEGTVVPVLGSRVHGELPDAEELAAHLADTFNLGSSSLDLAEVAQHVAVAKGPSFLYRAVKDVLRHELEPHALHRFLAAFPKRAAEFTEAPRYQMIVTTNYDTALERAFDSAGEEYDLAVFLANGPDRGRFIHIPWRSEPELITEPSKYRRFPIDPYDELDRTVIVKILGAVDGGEGDVRWDRSYVLTEDQYIDYLVADQIGSVVPLQILNKLTSSHCLFLGYAMRDWSLRVFLKRIWQGRPLEDKSWAIERDPDPLEKDFWTSLQVELLIAAPDDYARRLNDRIGAWRESTA